MPFNESELYFTLVEDILGKEIPKYDNLVIFIHNILNKKVKRWCYNDSVLRCGMQYEDVMQEVQIKIIKTCEDYFFKPVNGKTDKTCDEFIAWCNTVAKNYFITYCVKQKKRKQVEVDLSSVLDEQSFDSEDELSTKENVRDELKNCFVVVFDLKSSPHILLTWLCVSLFMVEYDASKIESTHLLSEKFSELTLGGMFDLVVKLAGKYDWLDIDKNKIDKQSQRLDVIDSVTGKRIGDMKYSEFYMNKGPEMSISDWINRVNSQIRKHINVD